MLVSSRSRGREPEQSVPAPRPATDSVPALPNPLDSPLPLHVDVVGSVHHHLRDGRTHPGTRITDQAQPYGWMEPILTTSAYSPHVRGRSAAPRPDRRQGTRPHPDVLSRSARGPCGSRCRIEAPLSRSTPRLEASSTPSRWERIPKASPWATTRSGWRTPESRTSRIRSKCRERRRGHDRRQAPPPSPRPGRHLGGQQLERGAAVVRCPSRPVLLPAGAGAKPAVRGPGRWSQRRIGLGFRRASMP